MRKYINFRGNIALGLIFAFLANTFGAVPLTQADEFRLPAPGVRVGLSPEYNPPILKGLKVHPDNPLRFDFILDAGDDVSLRGARRATKQSFIRAESTKLIKYFLASLTIPEKDLWVNLSPYEKNRIIPQSFGLTEMGRDLLAEDYMLKQITASLIYPEDEIGKKFWKRIYEEAARKFGTTNIPVNTFNKVWIVPEKAVVYENAKAGTAYVVEAKLKVMLEEDYLAIEKNNRSRTGERVPERQPGDMFKSELQRTCPQAVCQASKALNVKAPQGNHLYDKQDTNALGSQIVREIVIPELTKEVNEGKNFSQLRQVYNSLILAMWYKKKIKDSILEQVYANKNKVAGVSIDDPQEKQRIYERYLQAFKKGAYNYIKEEIDPVTQETIPRKYFSGGVDARDFAQMVLKTTDVIDNAQLSDASHLLNVTINFEIFSSKSDVAMLSHTKEKYEQEVVKFYQEGANNSADLENARNDLLNVSLILELNPQKIRRFLEDSLRNIALSQEELQNEKESINKAVEDFLRKKYQNGLKKQAENLSAIRDFFIYELIILRKIPVSEFKKEYAWLPKKERWIEDRLVGKSIRKFLSDNFSTMIAKNVSKGAASLGSLDELRNFINYINSWDEFISFEDTKIVFTSQHPDQFKLFLRIAQWLNTFYSELKISVDRESKTVVLTVKNTIKDGELKKIYCNEAFHELNEAFEQVRLNYLQDIVIRFTVRKFGSVISGQLNLRFVMTLRSLLKKEIAPQNSDLINELFLFYEAWLNSGLHVFEDEDNVELISGDQPWEVDFNSLKRFVIEVLAQGILFDVIGGNNTYLNQRSNLLFTVTELIRYRNVDYDRREQSTGFQKDMKEYLRKMIDDLNLEIQAIGLDSSEKVKSILIKIGFSDEEIRDMAMAGGLNVAGQDVAMKVGDRAMAGRQKEFRGKTFEIDSQRFLIGRIYNPEFIKRERDLATRRKTIVFDRNGTLGQFNEKLNRFIPRKGVEEQLSKLKEMGYRLVLWTRGRRSFVKEDLSGLQDYFDLTITQENYVPDFEDNGNLSEQSLQELKAAYALLGAQPGPIWNIFEKSSKGAELKDITLLGYKLIVDDQIGEQYLPGHPFFRQYRYYKISSDEPMDQLAYRIHRMILEGDSAQLAEKDRAMNASKKIWDLAHNLVMVHVLSNDKLNQHGLEDLSRKFKNKIALFDNEFPLSGFFTRKSVEKIYSNFGEFNPKFTDDSVFIGGNSLVCLAKAVQSFSENVFMSGKKKVKVYLLAPYVWGSMGPGWFYTLEDNLKELDENGKVKYVDIDDFMLKELKEEDFLIRIFGKKSRIAGNYLGQQYLNSSTIKVQVNGRETIVHHGGTEHELIIDIVRAKDPRLKLDRARIDNLSSNKGGIDLTPAKMNVEVKKEIASSLGNTPPLDAEIRFHIDPAMLEQLRNAPGFVPVIINVQPMRDLRQFLTQ